MKQTLDNYEEFIEKTILEPISLDFFGKAFNNMDEPLDYRPSIGTLRYALLDAFKAGRNYQFDLQKP